MLINPAPAGSPATSVQTGQEQYRLEHEPTVPTSNLENSRHPIFGFAVGPACSGSALINAIKTMSNELKIPIVASGTLAALRAMQTEEQIANRFEPYALPRWENDLQWRTFINRFEVTLPLPHASNLHEVEIATLLHQLSEGLIGELATVLRRAARRAITANNQVISMEDVKALKFVPPSGRKIATELLMRSK